MCCTRHGLYHVLARVVSCIFDYQIQGGESVENYHLKINSAEKVNTNLVTIFNR